MQTVIIVVHLLIVLALIGVVLLQKSEGGALGMGGGGGFMSSRGSANVLTRATANLAGSFFLTSFGLAIRAMGSGHQGSIFKPSATVPLAPAVPQQPQPPAGPQ